MTITITHAHSICIDQWNQDNKHGNKIEVPLNTWKIQESHASRVEKYLITYNYHADRCANQRYTRTSKKRSKHYNRIQILANTWKNLKNKDANAESYLQNEQLTCWTMWTLTTNMRIYVNANITQNTWSEEEAL